jgi:hypothetical protein
MELDWYKDSGTVEGTEACWASEYVDENDDNYTELYIDLTGEGHPAGAGKYVFLAYTDSKNHEEVCNSFEEAEAAARNYLGFNNEPLPGEEYLE